MGRHHDAVSELVKTADVNKGTNLLGYTALHIAAELNDKRLAQILITVNFTVVTIVSLLCRMEKPMSM